ncbi:MAG: hypothetical protein Q7K98_02825 [Candidatus Omnitrophota bacterium]|nr:hypothetical protein [Candidatus Omnitrophota bacterium]
MPEALRKSIKINIVLVLIAALVFTLMRKISFSSGLLVSAAWSTVNFYLTLNLFEIAALRKSKKKLLLLLLIKFPVLYLLGFLILIVKFFPITSLLAGMSSILLVLGVSTIWPKRAKLNTSCQI